MALGRTYSVALVGLNGYIVEVEADIGQTLPAFVILGLPDAALNEAKERIRSAAQNSGIPLSRRKITANLVPASLPKRGSGFDLGERERELANGAPVGHRQRSPDTKALTSRFGARRSHASSMRSSSSLRLIRSSRTRRIG